MKYIAIDVDGTIVRHEYPQMGVDVPGAEYTIKDLVKAGNKIIIFTMRSGKELEDAVNWYIERGIPLYGVNVNPTQHTWTSSPKAYANCFIDDAALGCPLIYEEGERPYVDWAKVRILLIEQGYLE